MKILAMADQHIRDRDIEEITCCLDFIVETAKSEKPDLIISAGDFFHNADVKLDSPSAKLAIRTVSALADIAPIAILVGTASHDGMAPEIFTFAKGSHDKIVSVMPEQLYLSACSAPFITPSSDGNLYRSWLPGREQPAAVITMVPPVTKQFFQSRSDISGVDREIGEAMYGLFLGFGAQAAEYRSPHILVGHFNVSGATLSNSQVMTGRDIEVSRDQIALAHADLVTLGHIHLPQQIGENIFYSSSIYPVTVGEDHAHGFYIHELAADNLGKQINSRFIETPCRKLLLIYPAVSRLQERFYL